MVSERRTAVVVGVLFIVATGFAVLSGLLSGFLGEPDYLANITANGPRLALTVVFELVMVGAVLAIPVLLYPILKKQSAWAARGYLVARIIEGVVLVGCILSVALLMTLGKEYAAAGAADATQYRTLGTVLYDLANWSSLIGGQLIFAFTALILNVALLRLRLVPRLISIWGLVGVPLMLASALLVLFSVVEDSSALQTALMLPLAVQEIVFAVWIIAKGFNPTSQASQ